MTQTPDQDTQTAATSSAGSTSRQEPIPTGHAENTREQDTLDPRTGDQDVGNVPPSRAGEPQVEPPAPPREEPLKVTVKRRLEQEGRWFGQIELERDEMMRLARKERKLPKLEAQLWVYSELDRMYPPLEADTVLCMDDQGADNVRPADGGQIQGLGTIPEDWSELPANSSLAAEVAWVQANRLRIVEENPGRATIVRLGRALSPAPSWAALGWLETSIRSYAKYVDVAAKATASEDGEAEVWRHERRAIEDVAALLDEMRGHA